MRFDKDFACYWSSRYIADELGARERWLFSTVGPSVVERGYLIPGDLAEIGEWKTRRARSYLARNDRVEIEDVTRIAFSPTTPDRLRHRILCLLTGVGHPMASAILSVWKPEEHTVLDYRAVGSLQELAGRGLLEGTVPRGSQGSLPDYWAYLQLFRPIATRLGVSHRDLDHALWKWNKAGMPEKWVAG